MNMDENYPECRRRSSGLCNVCLKTAARYTCPRCNLPYCSLDCYKAESHAACSENFYQDWCLSEMRNLSVEPDQKKAMLEILKRSLNDSSQDPGSEENENEEEDLAERMEGLDLNTDIDMVWDKLTKSEQREFLRLIESGNISHFLKPCRPWWMPKLIEELGNSGSTESSNHIDCEVPRVTTQIKPLQQLLKSKSPSPFVLYTLSDVLLSYVYVFRYFNGEPQQEDVIEEAIDCYLTICRSFDISIKQPCPDLTILVAEFSTRFSVASTREKQRSMLYPFNPQLLLTLLHDLHLILSDKSSPCHSLQALLSDCRQLFKTAISMRKSHFNSEKSACTAVVKKLDFLLSYADSEEFQNQLHQRLLSELELELCSRLSCSNLGESDVSGDTASRKSSLKLSETNNTVRQNKIEEL